MIQIDPWTSAFWQMVGSALLCGTIIGFERQLRGKPAGIRTGCLVTLGAFDAARVEAQLRLRRGREEFRSLLLMVDSVERARQLTPPPTP